MKSMMSNAREVAAVVALVVFGAQWTLMGLETPAEGFAEVKRAALAVPAQGSADADASEDPHCCGTEDPQPGRRAAARATDR